MKLDSYEKWKNSAASLFDTLLESREFEEAHSLARKVLSFNPSENDFRLRYLKVLQVLPLRDDFRLEGLYSALLFLRERRPDKAIQVLESLLQVFPEDIRLMQKLAILTVETGEREKAETLYSSLGAGYAKRGVFEKAIEAYREMVRLNPGKFEYRQKIADVLVQQGKLRDAVSEYFELLRQYVDRQMMDKAVPLLEKVLTLDPSNLQATFELAKVFFSQNKIDDATKRMHARVEQQIGVTSVDDAENFFLEWIEFLLSRNQREIVHQEQEYLARILFSNDRKERAVSLFEKVANEERSIGRVEKFMELMQLAIDFYLAQGNIPKARTGYQYIILTLATTDLTKAKLFLDKFLKEFSEREQVGEIEKALREMVSELETKGSQVLSKELLRKLAEMYSSLYKAKEAIKIYEWIATKDGQDPTVYLALGELHLKDEDWPSALDSYMKAVRVYAQADQWDKAEEIFLFASGKDSKNPEPFCQMGDVYYASGKWDKALESYHSALEFDSGFREAIVGTAKTYAKKGMLDEMVALAKRLVTKGVIAEIMQEYKRAISVNLRETDAAMALGVLYRELGFVEEAILEFQKASKDPKCFLQASNQLALCFREQGFQDLAIRQLKRILDRPTWSDEELLETRYNLARMYEDAKMYRDARELYSDVLVIDIGYRDVSERIKKLSSAPGSSKIISFPSDWWTKEKKN